MTVSVRTAVLGTVIGIVGGCTGESVVDQVPTVEFNGATYMVSAPSGFSIQPAALTEVGSATGGTIPGVAGEPVYSLDGLDPTLVLAIEQPGPEPILLLFGPEVLDPPSERVSSRSVFKVPEEIRSLCDYVDPDPSPEPPTIEGCEVEGG